MEKQLGELAGKLYAQLHHNLSHQEQEQAAKQAADRMQPRDRPFFLAAWIQGYKSVDKQEKKNETLWCPGEKPLHSSRTS